MAKEEGRAEASRRFRSNLQFFRKLPGVLIIILLNLSLALAMEKPTKSQLQSYAKDGSLNSRVRNALAFENHVVAPDLVRDFRAQIERIRLIQAGRAETAIDKDSGAAPVARNVLQSKGTVKVFALLISFPDYPATQSPESIASKLFGEGDAGWPYESLRNYYRRSSYNTLNIEGNVLGWYTPPYARAGMPQTPEAREDLIKEALLFYYTQGHDFSQYDNNGDGSIDYFMVIWTGPDNGWGGFWWGYQTSLSDPYFSLNGKKLVQTRYSWLSDSCPDEPAFSPKAAIHETGNALGLADYYDYADQTGPRGGIGSLDMMDGGRGDHNPFSKMLLGWISPQVFNVGRMELTLRASGNSQDALLVIPESSPGQPVDEFFLVQNRFRAENDFYLPSDGLLIWHVDARVANDGRFQSNNSLTERRLLSLIEGDGGDHIREGRPACATDYAVEGKSIELIPDAALSAASADPSIYGIGPSGQTQYFTIDTQSPSSSQQSPMIQATSSGNISFAATDGVQATSSGVTYYVDATGGNDSNNGLSATTAWKTIQKVNSSNFSPGDTILLKRGEIWREQLTVPSGGSAGNPITLGSYSTGAKPIIAAPNNNPAITVTSANRGYWTIDGLDLRGTGSVSGITHSLAIYFNYWGADMGAVPGWTIKNCSFTAPILISGPNTTIQDNVFDGTGNTTALFGALGIRGVNGSGAIIERNVISNFVDRGIWVCRSADNCIVRNNTVHDIVAGSSNEGVGINFDGYETPMTGETCYGNTIYNCYYGITHENCINQQTYNNLIHDCPTFGIDTISYGAYRSQAMNGLISYNIIYNTNNGIRIFDSKNWSFLNNVIYQGTGTYTSGVKVMTSTTYTSNITFTNNIIAGTWDYPLNVPDSAAIWTQLDYNDIVPAGTLVMIQISGGSKTFAQLPALGYMAHGMTSDPLFVSGSSPLDFRLQPNSPCISRGIFVNLSADFAGNPVPAQSGKNPDIGAYEFEPQVTVSVPAVTTMTSPVVKSSTAMCGGSVTSDGGATVTERGVCWGSIANPTISGSHTHDGSGTGSYASSLTGLNAGTTYHVRAYATNSSGTGYGNDVTFTTLQDITPPTVTTSAVSSNTSTSATGGGNVTSDGGAAVTERGVCWGSTANPTISGSHTHDGSGTGSYTSSLTGLTAGTTYHVRAYATNSSGTGYGNDVTVTTAPTPLVPSASGSPTSGQAPLTVNFVASASGGVSPYTYRWAFGDGGSSTSQNPPHAYTSAGTYTAALTVTDSASTSASSTVDISVTDSVPPAGPLSSGIVPSATSGPAPLSVSFLGSANGGAAPYAYSWTFGDGGSSYSQSPSHAYATAGIYTATLTVTDSASRSARSTGSIIVGTATNNGTKYSLRQIVLLRKQGKKLW